MKKFIIASIVVLIILSGAGIVYLNNVLLPRTIKALIIKGIEERANSRVTLGSLRVNIFKGLVLTDLEVYGRQAPLIKIKEVSCVVFPFPILRKQIIIPSINIKSAQIFAERRSDKAFNLADLFSPKPAFGNAGQAKAKTASGPASGSGGFELSVYRVNIANSKIIFKDNALSKPFTKALENINAAVYLSLPASVKFKFSALIPDIAPVKIAGNGEFNVPGQELSAQLNIPGFSPGAFSDYYEDSGIKVSAGSLIDISSNLKIKNNVFYADIQAQGENLNISRDKINAGLNVSLRAVLEYGFSAKILKYSGSAKVYGASVSGIDIIDKASAVGCGIIFNNSGISTDNLTAKALGLSINARAALTDFNDPSIKVDAVSGLGLAALQGILKEKFKFNLAGSIDGQAGISLSAEGKLLEPKNLKVRGSLDLVNASLKLEKIDSPIQEINGKIEFLGDKFKWSGLSLKYRGELYKSTGSLSELKSPFLDIAINSGEFSLVSALRLNNKLINVYKCSGNYLSSQFSVSGAVDISDTLNPQAQLTGELLIDLKDLSRVLTGIKEQLDVIKPEGKLKASFNLAGKVSALKDCTIQARLSAGAISLYGLKMSDFTLDYLQAKGVADVSSLRLSLYGGSLAAAFRAKLDSEGYPYALDASIQNVKIEELKLDTLAKSKDISGLLQAAVKATGLLNDLSGSQGSGMLSIAKGKLWELDLFKGMGKILFSKDFANVTLSDGACDFTIRDKSISTDNLTLKGSMINLSGPVRIGFDNSINAKLNVDIISELVPLTGTFKDVTTAFIGETGKFAAIKISGTLKDPKYKFEPAVASIIQSLAGNLLKRI
ncbi:MAG: AsmA family protein [Candidatus Omnitrophota bacterium]